MKIPKFIAKAYKKVGAFFRSAQNIKSKINEFTKPGTRAVGNKQHRKNNR